MTPRLIGLTGHKGAGKDAVAAVLRQHGYTRIAFADPLKRIALAIGWDGSKEERPACSCCGMLQGRALLQVLGTEGVRQNIREDAWLLAANHEIGKHERVVITDVRFLNEAEFVRQSGGEVWRIERPGHGGDGHASETELDNIQADQEIWNGGSLADLAVAVERALRTGISGVLESVVQL